jgi:hypothetical protein
VAFLKGDEEVSFAQVARAIDLMRGAGIDHVGLITPRYSEQCHSDRSHVEKHPLRATLGGARQSDETIARIPLDPVPICVRNNAAASHIVRNSKRDFEGFGNEGMPEVLS